MTGAKTTSKTVKRSRELLEVAENVIWFKTPKDALSDRTGFLCHVMTFGSLDEVLTVQRHFSLADFRIALEHAPPGVFDIRSWHYWNIVCARTPVPPLPQRKIPGADPAPQSHSRWS